MKLLFKVNYTQRQFEIEGMKLTFDSMSLFKVVSLLKITPR